MIKIDVCINYQRLSEVTKKDTFPVPDVKDALDSLRRAKYFAILIQYNNVNLYAKISTNVQQTTVGVASTLSASIQMEALTAAAETVTMETDFSAEV